MKKIVLLVTLMSSFVAFSQKDVNTYKYIIIPKQFNFFKSVDKYKTSSLTKFLFNKYGFKAFLSDEVLPVELTQNRCLALIANVKDNSGMFTTKNVIELKDCDNNVILTSVEGKSKIKEYRKAYHQAIREAFTSIKKLNYKYSPLKKEIIVKTESIPVIVEASKFISSNNQSAKISKIKSKNVLCAQSTTYGFQLANTEPKVLFKMLQTSIKNIYVIKDKNGILYKSGNSWIAEYYSEGKKRVEKYLIKF